MTNLLDQINEPADIKKLTPGNMNQLAQEIRDFLVTTVAETGGHLASNLGVVELTLALHYVFDTPLDKVIWDVGHQSYVHKILTGRRAGMAELRKYKGLSGFPKIEENQHDAFGTGHSSTSISAAVGIALGRDLQQQKHSVVAVIGDGALTGGMAFEALNHAGHLGLDMTVVLNDNAMSISQNVGAMSTYLSKLRSDPAYSRKKEELEQILSKIPGIGPNLVKVAGKMKDLVKYLVVPGMLFEELGFTYLGPIDGHNLEDMIAVFQKACRMKGPVLIHVMTQKGKGYAPAFDNPDEFHGIGPFNISTGLPLKGKSRTYTQVFGDFMEAKAADLPNLVAITAAMTSGTGLERFAEKYPKRFFDVGICEEHAVTMAAGMARSGLKPVVAIYSTFMQRAYDQVIHDVCLQNLPVVFALDRAGLVGEDGPTHHGVFDLGFMRQIPNMIVMAPANEDELNDMLHSALSYDQPVAIRYPRGGGEGVEVKEIPEILTPGQAVLLQNGEHLVLMAVGRGVKIARETAEILKSRGISAAVINARFVKPLDETLINIWGAKCQRVVTIEDNMLAGGFGGAVAEVLSARRTKVDLLRIGLPDIFVEHGDIGHLLADLGMDAKTITEEIISRWPDLRKIKAAGGM